MVSAVPMTLCAIKSDPAPAPRPKASWLRGLPACRREGGMVYVTLALDPAKLSSPTSLGWSAGGVHATTPKIAGSTVTCCIPRGIFAQRANVKLELLDSSESDRPVLAWTQFPVLGEAIFRAGFDGGVPILRPLHDQDGTVVAPSGAIGMPWGPSAR